MAEIRPGQRWVSDAEPQLGMGTIQAVDPRRITVVFPAGGVTRTYARSSAPLTRVRFRPGDTVRNQDGLVLTVESIRQQQDQLIYLGRESTGESSVIEEDQLDSSLQLHRPAQRLLSGQIDPDKWFALRATTLEQANRLAHSRLYGLTGCRTSLIPHQLYIAHEVAKRYAPRVLLADEVGLGKTIEAGLILHQQLLTERAHRIIIVVPENLLHQWLVEMLRRFNLHFCIFDEERCQAIETSSGQDNPFHTEQLVLCSLEFLSTSARRFKQAYTGAWDILVVDEAHHLTWSPDEASLEYELVQMLAEVTAGVLLLTATPEQLGKTGHFARLHLLDPDRFPDLDAFVAEEQGYEPVATAVATLLDHQTLNSTNRQNLLDSLPQGPAREQCQRLLQQIECSPATSEKHQYVQQLVTLLLDRHGTGRILFRNTRSAVQGFAPRQLRTYPLPLPAVYSKSLQALAAASTNGPAVTQNFLCPELAYQLDPTNTRHWTQIDPRVRWLIDLLNDLRTARCLVITACATSALAIVEALRVQAGIHAAVFHEGMSLVQRDRSAAWFADQTTGAQVLICSEVGSEGRNFQFAHHLILFDLPLNPDLLEQRIGRLDRIGQTATIQLHVPFLEPAAQAIMVRWYQEGLGAFEQTCPAGHNVFVQVENSLREALQQPVADENKLNTLIEHSRKLHAAMNAALRQGRDRLLEYHSCRPKLARTLQSEAKREDINTDLPTYLENVFDCFGVDSEYHGPHSSVIRPGEHMHSHNLVGLKDDGITYTCHRETALANEDMHFLTWEHPLVMDAMDRMLSSELGNSTVSLITGGKRRGSLFLECLYRLETPPQADFPVHRYLPPATLRVVIDESGKNLTAAFTPQAIDHLREHREPIPRESAQQFLRDHSQQLKTMVAKSENLARKAAPEIITAASRSGSQALQSEIDRLRALQAVNPNVRLEEIQYFETTRQTLDKLLQAADLRLDALRLLIAI